MNAQTQNDQTINRAENPDQVVSAAQSQWFSRPADEKFSDLESLLAHTQKRRQNSYELKTTTGHMGARNGGRVGIDVMEDTKAIVNFQGLNPTHHGFNQLASRLDFRAGELRKLSGDPTLVVNVLNHLMVKKPLEGVKLMALDRSSLLSVAEDGSDYVPGPFDLTAVTGQDYGRIWDADVVGAAKQLVESTDGRFFSPLDWGKQKRALFAGDRDVFMFFCDGGSIVDGGGDRDQLHRGFYVWNSEVGTRTMGISTFLFRAVCGNFGIWGHEDVRVVKIRHTSGGPERFVTEAVPALNEFVKMSAKPLEARVRAAKAYELPTDEGDFMEFFKKRGFTLQEVRHARQHALAEEGAAHTLWLMHNGFTAYARHMAWADAKLDLETKAGKLMDVVREN